MPPISPASPDYLFDRTSVGSLHRKLEKEEFVGPEELALIGDADRTAFSDTIFQEQVLLALRGELKRVGRPPDEQPIDFWFAQGITALIDDRAAEIRVARKGVRTRGEVAPREQAAEEVARFLKLSISGRSLLNSISRTKNPAVEMMSSPEAP